MNRDERGSLTEIFRGEWDVGVAPCQWSAVSSQANVLRGVHAHRRHSDYLVVLRGRMTIGLYDVRPRSPTFRTAALIEMSGDRQSALCIPTGVMHGFYSHENTLHVYGVDSYYDPDDELGCYWSDPRLGIAWPCSDPLLCERDRTAGPLSEVEARLCTLSAEFR